MTTTTPTPIRPLDAQEEAILRRASIGIALLRTWCGLWFLIVAYQKLPIEGLEHWAFPGELERSARDFAQLGALEWYRPFLERIGRDPVIFAYGIAFGELLVGVLLLFGFFTRTAAWLGIFFSFNYLCATAGIHRAYPSMNLWIMLGCWVVLMGRGGLQFGADRLWLKER